MLHPPRAVIKRVTASTVVAILLLWVGRVTQHRSQSGHATIKNQLCLDDSELEALPLVQAIARFNYTPPDHDQVNVSVCAAATHENQFLPEWIAWHRLLGVQRIYLFDNQPSRSMSNLLRPWLIEGSVTLFELDYDKDAIIGELWQHDLLRLCQRHVLSKTKWAVHHDVDEFIQIHPLGLSPSVPAYDETKKTWIFPLHDRLDSLSGARCVPMSRNTWPNLGVVEIGLSELVTRRHIVRNAAEVSFATYGKVFLHSEFSSEMASWHGPHSCRPIPELSWEENVIKDPLGRVLTPQLNIYPSEGMPMTADGISLNHYIQRSLSDCYRKYSVVKRAEGDWRAVDGLDGCARNFVPTNSQIHSSELRKLERANLLEQRDPSWSSHSVVDTGPRNSWAGRMTKFILDEWRNADGTLKWIHGVHPDNAAELPNIYRISM